MPNAHDQLSILFHLVDKLHWQHATVKCFAKLLGCSIQSTTKAVTLRKNNIYITDVKMGFTHDGLLLSVNAVNEFLFLTMVRRPDVRLEMRSLPARAQTIVLWAPETAGP